MKRGFGGGPYAFFAVLVVLESLFVPFFFSLDNAVYLGLSVSMVGMVACSMLLCLISGEFDLSIEGTVVLAGVLCALVYRATENLALGVATGLVAGLVVGLANGLVVAKLRINSLIATLAMLYIVRGLSFTLAGGRSIPIDSGAFFAFGNGAFLGIPWPVLVTLATFGLFGLVLNQTTLGRQILAVGGDREAAHRAGIDVDGVKIRVFAIQGVVAAAAGIVLAARMTSGQPNSATGFALDVIAACMLGGVSAAHGTGTVRGVLVGVLIMGTVENAMNLIGIPSFYQYLTKGSILLAALLFDRFSHDRALGRSRAPAQPGRRPPMTRRIAARSVQNRTSVKPAPVKSASRPAI